MMLRFLVPLVLLLSTVNSIQDLASYSPNAHSSAASPAQIRFAIENKYDDTGPGAKKPEYAYNTYKNLEDALIAYLDDPDTKLPELEREKAIQKLIVKSQGSQSTQGLPPNQIQPEFNRISTNPHFTYQIPVNYPTNKVPFSGGYNGAIRVKGVGNQFITNSQPKVAEPFNVQKFHTVKGNPLSLAHYTRGLDQFQSFSKAPFALYKPGDTKRSAETRNAEVVYGYYTFVDSKGKHNIVHYSGNDKNPTQN